MEELLKMYLKSNIIDFDKINYIQFAIWLCKYHFSIKLFENDIMWYCDDTNYVKFNFDNNDNLRLIYTK